MADRGEWWRTVLCFGLFAGVVVAVMLRLVYLQGARSTPNLLTVRKARDLVDPMPFARGPIFDRHGRPLAYDRPTLIVRADYQARVKKKTKRIPSTDIDRMAQRLASHVAAGDVEARRALAKVLTKRIVAAKHAPMKTRSKRYDFLQAEFLVHGALDSHEAVRRLRGEVELWKKSKELPGRLHLTFLKNYTRTYPGRDYTRGVVGNYWLDERKEKGADGKEYKVKFAAATGTEVCKVLWAPTPKQQKAAKAQQVDFKDARRRRFWTGFGKDPIGAGSVHTTLDLDLQKLAYEELRKADELVREKRKSSIDWGAIVLVSIPDGDILAMESYYPGAKGPKPFAPIENAFEPGSVVKPLLLAYALEKGTVGWHQKFDCTPTVGRLGRPVKGYPRRIIKDDHRCEVLTPLGIIQNSSNIGAVQIGLSLQPKGMQEYMQAFQLCERTGLPLAGEARGMGPGMTYEPRKRGVKGLHNLDRREFGQHTGPSVSFGYEHNVTAVQLARAYLRLLTGQKRELRYVTRVEKDGEAHEAPRQEPERFLSDDTVRKVHEAMIAVVTDEEGVRATGRNLYRMLADMGHDQPLIAGKTGTADSSVKRKDGVRVRGKTAAFVGYAPVAAPKYLAVCVLRKVGAVKFYGGSYAAPSVGRLLLGALAEQASVRAPLRLVRAWPGVRGSSSGNIKSGGK